MLIYSCALSINRSRRRRPHRCPHFLLFSLFLLVLLAKKGKKNDISRPGVLHLPLRGARCIIGKWGNAVLRLCVSLWVCVCVLRWHESSSSMTWAVAAAAAASYYPLTGRQRQRASYLWLLIDAISLLLLRLVVSIFTIIIMIIIIIIFPLPKSLKQKLASNSDTHRPSGFARFCSSCFMKYSINFNQHLRFPHSIYIYILFDYFHDFAGELNYLSMGQWSQTFGVLRGSSNLKVAGTGV